MVMWISSAAPVTRYLRSSKMCPAEGATSSTRWRRRWMLQLMRTKTCCCQPAYVSICWYACVLHGLQEAHAQPTFDTWMAAQRAMGRPDDLPDTYVYPRECQRLDFARANCRSIRLCPNLVPLGARPTSNETRLVRQRKWNDYIVSTGVGQPNTGGCDPETKCSATPVATFGSTTRQDDGRIIATGDLRTNWDSMEAWYGVKCRLVLTKPRMAVSW